MASHCMNRAHRSDSVATFVALTTAAWGLGIGCTPSPQRTPTPHSPQDQGTEQARSPMEARAAVFVDELAHGRWEHPQTAFDSALSAAMPSAKLQALWQTLESTGGPFRRVDGTRLQSKDDFQVALVTCQFDRLRKVLRVVFDRENRVAGLFYGPVPEEIEAKTRSLITAASRGDFALAS